MQLKQTGGSHPWESPSLYKHAEAQHKRSVFCLLTLMGGSQSLDLLKQGTVVHSCLTEHLSGGPMYYSSGRVCSWISPCHGLFSLCPQWCADGLMMRQVSGRWRMHLAAADHLPKRESPDGKRAAAQQMQANKTLLFTGLWLAGAWQRWRGNSSLFKLNHQTGCWGEQTHLPVTHRCFLDNASECGYFISGMLLFASFIFNSDDA